MTRVRIEVTVELERQSGKFVSKDDLAAEIEAWIEGANEGEVSGVGADGDSIYDVVDWTVEVLP